MVRLFLFLAILAASSAIGSARGQGLTRPGVVDLTGYAKQSDVANAVSAATPPTCVAAPAPDTLNGARGTATPCVHPADASRPTAVQAINTTLAANCTWVVTFARAFASASPIVHAELRLAAGATMPVACQPLAVSSTGASGKCFPAQTTALNLSIVTAGLTLSPFAQSCTAGMTVMVVGREATQ